jgi:non-specific serine/threonine protein kinase
MEFEQESHSNQFYSKLKNIGLIKPKSASKKSSNKKVKYDHENDFSFMESIDKILSKNHKMNSESLNSLPDISTNHWTNLIKNKKNLVKDKIQKFFEFKKESKTKDESMIRRGRFMLSSNSKRTNYKPDFTQNQKTPKNLSSKKTQLRISKSNNINKKHFKESFENSQKVDCSVLESHRKRHFGSSKKKKSDKRERMKSEIPSINPKFSKIEKKFSNKFHNCLPFPEKLYKMIGVLGKGSYGVVFLAVHLISGQKVAIKAIKKNRNNDVARNYKKITNEIEIFSSLNHKNIISLYEVFENRKYIFLVTEYAEKGDLLSLLQRSGPFSESQIYIVIKDIINALMFIHKQNILHRDIKLDNILLDKDNNLKLCDFGISLKIDKDTYYTDRCGTPAYIAPEIIKSKYKGFKSDYWSLGVTLFILLTASPPFKAKSFNSIKGLILKKPVEFPSDISDITEDLKTLIE